jgi:SAM-dependent methyltransferase
MDQTLFHQMADIQTTHWWYEGRRFILRTALSRLNLKPNAKILEVGCGTGANLLMLKEFGTVSGIEPNEFARDTAIKHSGCVITEGYLPDDLRLNEKFDLIGAFDVIEHIDDDLGSAKALHDALNPGGVALFTVPAYQFLWSQHDVANHHKRRYTRTGFRKLLEEAGFRVEFISYYNTWLFPLVLGVRIVKKIFKMKDTPDETMPRWPFINTALRLIFSSEAYILQHISLPFGVSIIARCTRP